MQEDVDISSLTDWSLIDLKIIFQHNSKVWDIQQSVLITISDRYKKISKEVSSKNF